jgi:hypothetical protein
MRVRRRNSMTEPERIKNLEEQIALAGLLLGVDLSRLPIEDSLMLKRFALDLYRLGHASGFKAGVDHATNALAVIEPLRIPGFAGRVRRDS